MKKFINALAVGLFCPTVVLSQAFAVPVGAKLQRVTGGGGFN